MLKDYKRWHKRKTRIHKTKGTALFQEREVWWCILGQNVGYEQDGGRDFARPVVILKKFNLDTCLIVPLTGHSKTGRYYFSVGEVQNRTATAILSQLRFVDRKRLENKICVMEKKNFQKLIRAIVAINFPI